MKTSGSFKVSDVHIYRMDAAYLGNRTVYPLKAADEAEQAHMTALGEKDEPEDIDTFGPNSKKVVGRTMAEGVITMPEKGYFVTSFPFQPGCHAYVDGERQEIELVNTAFVGFPLEAGTHKIQLTYEPPLQKAGMMLSAVGWLVWLGIAACARRKGK